MHKNAAKRSNFTCNQLRFDEDITVGNEGADVLDPRESSQFTSNLPHRLLLNNQTVLGEVGENCYDFFQVCLNPTKEVLRVSLMLLPLSGDPDLYVSTKTARPTLATSDFISARLGDDVISLRTDHPDLIDELRTIYISVFGRNAGTSRYSLTGNCCGYSLISFSCLAFRL